MIDGVINAMDNKFGYFSKDVAQELQITTSSLRRWSIELENEGYNFQRNEKKQRIYYERDFKAFRELKKLLANSVPFTDAIKAICTRDFEEENAQQTPSVYSEMVRLSKRELQDIVKQAVEEEREILLQAIQEKLDNTIESRDRILTQQLRKNFEENQQKLLEVSLVPKAKWWDKLKRKGNGEN